MIRLKTLSWLGLSMLTACSSYGPPANLSSVSRDDLVARMGQPEMVRQTATGSRLEFPRGPMGHHTWFVDLDATGHATRAEQVLTEPNLVKSPPLCLRRRFASGWGAPV